MLSVDENNFTTEKIRIITVTLAVLSSIVKLQQPTVQNTATRFLFVVGSGYMVMMIMFIMEPRMMT